MWFACVCVPSVWHAFRFRYVSSLYYVLLRLCVPVVVIVIIIIFFCCVLFCSFFFLQQIRYGSGVKKGLPGRRKGCRVQGAGCRVEIAKCVRQVARLTDTEIKAARGAKCGSGSNPTSKNKKLHFCQLIRNVMSEVRAAGCELRVESFPSGHLEL